MAIWVRKQKYVPLNDHCREILAAVLETSSSWNNEARRSGSGGGSSGGSVGGSCCEEGKEAVWNDVVDPHEDCG